MSSISDETAEHRFDALYDRYGPLIYRRARRILDSARDAEVTLQGVFVKLGKALQRGDLPAEPLPWLFRATTTHCLGKLRPQLRARSRRRETMDDALRVLPELGEREAMALMLSYYDRMTDSEIAVALGISEATAHDLLAIGHRRIERHAARPRRVG